MHLIYGNLFPLMTLSISELFSKLFPQALQHLPSFPLSQPLSRNPREKCLTYFANEKILVELKTT